MLYSFSFEDLGMSLDHAVKVNAYLNNIDDLAVWNDVFEPPYPYHSTMAAPLVTSLMELEITASIGEPT